MRTFPLSFTAKTQSWFWSRGYIVKNADVSKHFSFRKLCYRILFPSAEISLKEIFYTQFPKDYVDLHWD